MCFVLTGLADNKVLVLTYKAETDWSHRMDGLPSFQSTCTLKQVTGREQAFLGYEICVYFGLISSSIYFYFFISFHFLSRLI